MNNPTLLKNNVVDTVFSQLQDYRHLVKHQTHVMRELILLQFELIPLLKNERKFKSYVKRWCALTAELKHPRQDMDK